jgi:hypothetical protein
MERAVGSLLLYRMTGEKEAGKSESSIRRDLERDLAEHAKDLAGEDPTPIERTLAETAALCWLDLRLAELNYLGASGARSGLTAAASEHYQRCINNSHRRLLITLKTLATVRKLAVPAVQVNIARRQVNQQVVASD